MNKVFFHDSRDMCHVADNSVQLIITSPPYFNIKDYAKDGYQQQYHSQKHAAQIGDIVFMMIIWMNCWKCGVSVSAY